MHPKISVIMPVLNGGEYVAQAVHSILAQSFQNLELIVVDDGSKDASAEIVSSFSDSRIRLLRNLHRLGISVSLNRGIATAKGEYIARMDCDDICMPERLGIQHEFLELHPAVQLCGTWAKHIDLEGNVIGFRKAPIGDQLQYGYWRPSPFIHPTVMMRTGVARAFPYNETLQYAEDYELWLRISEKFSFANISEYLLLYRVHSKGATDIGLADSHRVFQAWLGCAEVDFGTFTSLVRETYELHPRQRFAATQQIGKKVRLPRRLLLSENFRYTRRWLKRRLRQR